MSSSWYNTGRRLRLFGVDGRVVFLFVFFLGHIRWWTFVLFVLSALALAFLDYRGYTVPNAIRRIRVLVMGPHRPAVLRKRLGRSDR